MTANDWTMHLDQASTTQVMASVLDDALCNIISDIVLRTHREEKLSRMQSAAIVAVQRKESTKLELGPGEEPPSITTEGAIISEENRIYLHGNPLVNARDVLCLTCRQPRLLQPTTGKGSRAAGNLKKYCPRHPFIDKEGCDIYGKPLAVEKPSKKKAATKEKAKNGSGSGSDSGNEENTKKEKSTTAMPSAKCPTCPRYLYFSRIAHHLERCAGIGGRASSRNAKEKLNSNTPKDTSRASTPKPSSQATKLPAKAATKANGTMNKKRKKGSDDEDDSERTPVKKKKFGKKEGKGKALNADIARVKGAEKRLPGSDADLQGDD